MTEPTHRRARRTFAIIPAVACTSLIHVARTPDDQPALAGLADSALSSVITSFMTFAIDMIRAGLAAFLL